MRRTFTAKEKAFVFELWKNGTGFSEIANILGSKPRTIFNMLRDTGGIKPNERRRAAVHLTLSEREEIRASLSAKMSILKWNTKFGHLKRTAIVSSSTKQVA
jgi:IS30 family transposase